MANLHVQRDCLAPDDRLDVDCLAVVAKNGPGASEMDQCSEEVSTSLNGNWMMAA